MQDIDLTKQILSGNQIKQKLVYGANKVADSVKTTLGPMGKNVIIALNKYGDSKITKDGVSVAKEIFLEDKYENLGAQLIKKVSAKCATDAGDGTTTSTVLAQAFLNYAFENYKAIKNVHDFKKGMESCCEKVVEYLKSVSTPVKTLDDIYNVAMISSNGDTEISGLIRQCYEKLGLNDIVVKLDSSSYFLKSWVEIAEGFQYDKGLPSPYLVTDYQKMEASYKDAYVLFFDGIIQSFESIAPYLEYAIRNNKLPLAIVAHEFQGNTLNQIVANKLQKNYSFVAIESPGYGGRRKLLLEDLAVMTGGTVISDEKGNTDPSNVGNCFGRVSSLTSNQYTTLFQFGYGDENEILFRIQSINESLDKNMEFDRQLAKERISNLTSGMAVFHVGASTELEIKETYDRVEDACWAVKSAIQEGICTGEGLSLLKAKQAIESENVADAGLTDDYKLGFKTVLGNLDCIFKQLVSNAGLPSFEPSALQEKMVLDLMEFDFTSGQWVAYSGKIIDPTKVLRCALQNAVSVCSLIMTTEVGIVYKNDLKTVSEVK